MTLISDFLHATLITANELSCILLTLLLLLLVIFTLSCNYAWMKKRTLLLLLPPGPCGVPLFGNLLSLDLELHSYFMSLAQIYGPIFKLQLGNKTGIVVSSPSLAYQALKDHNVTFVNHDVSAAGKAATYGGSDIVWCPYGPEWRMLRKVFKMLSNTTSDSIFMIRRKQVQETVRYFYDQNGSPGASLGADFREVVSLMTEFMGKPNISDFYPGLTRFDLQGIKRQMDGLAKRFDRIFDVMINQRLKIDKEGGNKESKDFLQFLLKLKDEGDSKTPFTMIHLKAMFTRYKSKVVSVQRLQLKNDTVISVAQDELYIMYMMVGGTDTSSNTIEFAMAEIMNKLEVMRNTQQELEAVVGKDNIVEESHIHKLPYLHAVIKETLRLHAPVPLLVPRCPSETRTRFLDGKWDYSGSDFSYFPFGSGRRICAGIAMAERMMMYSLATLLHSFNWKLPQGEKLDLTEKFGIVLKKKIPLVAIPTPRLYDPSMYE
ncbi:hypothetical protein ACB092_10G056500 [Castanea dentata]